MNDLVWIQFKPHLISFRFKGIPTNIHFTISFNKNSDFINLHLTKNNKLNENESKPKIEILRLRKNDLNELTPQFIYFFINQMLEKIDILTLNTTDYQFLPLDIFDTKEDDSYKKMIIENFKDISNIKRKNRLKIKGDIESKVVDLATDDYILEIIENKMTNLESLKDDIVRGGMYIKDNGEILNLIKIHNEWFELNLNLKPTEILSKIFGEDYSNYLIKYTKESLINIEKTNNYEDCKSLNNPLILELKKEEKPACNIS